MSRPEKARNKALSLVGWINNLPRVQPERVAVEGLERKEVKQKT